MPIYKFECLNCAKKVQKILLFSEIEKYLKMECSHCNKPSLKLEVSRSTFSLKGGGWYKDGYSK